MALIVLMIIVSLLPANWLYKFIERKIDPRRSGKRFLAWLLLVFIFIFAYTFLVVFIIRLVFPGA
jgi:hypothetical protein